MTQLASRRAASLALVLAACGAPSAAASQSLADRIAGAGDGAVSFSFSAPAGVCGDGRSYVSIGSNMIIGSWIGGASPTERGDCAPGPVRVRLTQTGGTVVDLATTVGPADTIPVRDLGTVRNEEASSYLLGLASRGEGAPARDAIMPAAMAGGAGAWRPLLALARDDARPAEVRRSAVSWMARLALPNVGAPAGEIATALTALAEDGAELRPVRESALAAIGRLGAGAGVPSLQRLTRSDDVWIAERAATQLARSGDPRSRSTLRELATDGRMPESVRIAAVRGIARHFMTGDDAGWLRESWLTIPDESVRRAVLDGLREAAGPENARWMLSIARDGGTPVALRRRALTHAAGLDVPSAELVALWNQIDDARIRDDLLTLYARRADRATVDQLLSVARDSPDAQLRRRAISRLSSIDDPRVAEALRRIVGGGETGGGESAGR